MLVTRGCIFGDLFEEEGSDKLQVSQITLITPFFFPISLPLERAKRKGKKWSTGHGRFRIALHRCASCALMTSFLTPVRVKAHNAALASVEIALRCNDRGSEKAIPFFFFVVAHCIASPLYIEKRKKTCLEK